MPIYYSLLPHCAIAGVFLSVLSRFLVLSRLPLCPPSVSLSHTLSYVHCGVLNFPAAVCFSVSVLDFRARTAVCFFQFERKEITKQYYSNIINNINISIYIHTLCMHVLKNEIVFVFHGYLWLSHTARVGFQNSNCAIFASGNYIWIHWLLWLCSSLVWLIISKNMLYAVY